MRAMKIIADDGHEYEVRPTVLGSGAQGAVNRARRTADGLDVAIKRINGGAPRELEIAEKLKSVAQPRHLLVPFAAAVDGADLLLVMPLAQRSLADEIAAHPGGMEEAGVLDVLHDVTAGLIELLDAGIVHRDLKPGNILLCQGRWCLADFGMSRDVDVRTATLTYTNGGTPLYYAPERLRMQPATHKGDLYALGCIGYELAAGEPPFNGSTLDQLLRKQLSTPPPAPPVGATLSRWIVRLLDKEPARRHQDARAAQASLPMPRASVGVLAAAALQHEQRRQLETARDGEAADAAHARAALRTQALADLEEICAAAADEAKLQIPDLTWTGHGHAQQFVITDLRLSITIWNDADQDRDLSPLVLAGEVAMSRPGAVRRVANVVCEEPDGALRWSLDTVTTHPLSGIDGDPQGLARSEFFSHYHYLRPGITHTWVRDRQPFTAQCVIGLLVRMLQGPA